MQGQTLTISDWHNLIETAAIVIGGATFVIGLINKNGNHEIKTTMSATATELAVHTAQDDLKFGGLKEDNERMERKMDQLEKKLDEKLDDIGETVNKIARNGGHGPHPTHPRST